MSRLKDLAYGLARLICRPAGNLEIGGISQQLLRVLQNYTEKNDKLRKKVHGYIEFMVETGDFCVDEYDGNAELAKKDYDELFY